MKHNTDKEIIVQNGRVRVRTLNLEPSKTQQQFADQCDVNKIIAKYKTTGEFNHVTRSQGAYADFTKITDYHSMLNQIQYAQGAFATLPAEMRLRFGNDPAALLTFLQNPSNRDEAVRLGLVNPKIDSIEPNNAKNDDDLTTTNTQKMAKKTESKKQNSTET